MMPKKPKANIALVGRKERSGKFHPIHPWQCNHQPDYSEIIAYVEASGQWEIVMTVRSTSGLSAETLANFMVGLANDHQRDRPLLQDAMRALETITKEGLTFTTEQEADAVVKRIKNLT